MSYYLLIAFKVFCVYHIVKNRNPYFWIFIVIFIPIVGGIVYLLRYVYNKRDAEQIQENLTNILVPTKKVKDLKKQLEFSETYQNKVNLADAYFEMKDFDNAIIYYEDAATDKSQNNYFIKSQLVRAYYKAGQYEKTIAQAKDIESVSGFNKSMAQFTYGLSLEKVGKLDEAEAVLKQIDQRYDNYLERLTLAKFLLGRDKTEEAKAILIEMSDESKHMTKPNKKKHRNTFNEVGKLLKSL